MKTTDYSAGRAARMLAFMTAIAGLFACLPVPIGDPERSRIDSGITGIWASLRPGNDAFYAFEPYDKRTWLLTGIPIEAGRNADPGNFDVDTYAGLERLVDNVSVGADGVTATSIIMYKAWLSKMAGEWFITWEPKGLIDKDGFAPEYWLVFKLIRPDANTMELYMVDGEEDVFQGVAKTRRAYERVLKRNIGNDDIFDSEPIRLIRVKPEHLEFVDKLAHEVIELEK